MEKHNKGQNEGHNQNKLDNCPNDSDNVSDFTKGVRGYDTIIISQYSNRKSHKGRLQRNKGYNLFSFFNHLFKLLLTSSLGPCGYTERSEQVDPKKGLYQFYYSKRTQNYDHTYKSPVNLAPGA